MELRELDELRLKFITARLEGKIIQVNKTGGNDLTKNSWVDCVDSSSQPHVHPELCRVKPSEVVYVVMVVPTHDRDGEYIDVIFKDLDLAADYVKNNQDVELVIREIELNS